MSAVMSRVLAVREGRAQRYDHDHLPTTVGGNHDKGIHGYSKYVKGCRCETCREAAREARFRQRAKKRLQQSGRAPEVDVV